MWGSSKYAETAMLQHTPWRCTRIQIVSHSFVKHMSFAAADLKQDVNTPMSEPRAAKMHDLRLTGTEKYKALCCHA